MCEHGQIHLYLPVQFDTVVNAMYTFYSYYYMELNDIRSSQNSPKQFDAEKKFSIITQTPVWMSRSSGAVKIGFHNGKDKMPKWYSLCCSVKDIIYQFMFTV